MSKRTMPRKLLATFLVLTIASSVIFFSIGYYTGYRVGFDAAFLTPG